MLTPSDFMEIQNLPGKYAQYWDDYELDAFSTLFTDEALVDLGGTVLRGPEEIRAFHEIRVGGFRKAGIQRRHLLGSIVISATTATEAAMDLYGQVFSTEATSGVTLVMPPVRYHGVVVKEITGRWKIANWIARPDRPFSP